MTVTHENRSHGMGWYNNVTGLNPPSSRQISGKVYSIQHYVIKFVSDLRQVGGFLRVPPPIKLTATI
jgi:predicted aconitase